MKTRVITVDSTSPDRASISDAAHVLSNGGLVAFPTETVYGLGADAFNPAAVRKVFEVKGRPPAKPLIIHFAEFDQIKDVVRELPTKAEKLANKFWPGPLTLVLQRTLAVPDVVTGGLDKVGVRIPDHAVTQEIIKALGKGIVGPSANRSGAPSPTRAEHVLEDLEGQIDLIVDAGPTELGIESTVVDLTRDPPLVLRLGALSQESLESIIGPVETIPEKRFLNRSPGTLRR